MVWHVLKVLSLLLLHRLQSGYQPECFWKSKPHQYRYEQFWHFCKLINLTGNTVIKTCSNRKQQVTFTDCVICGIASMHSNISNIQFMICWKCPFSHNGCNNRNLCQLCKFFASSFAPEILTPPPIKNNGFFACESREFAFKLPDMNTFAWLIASDFYFFWIKVIALF